MKRQWRVAVAILAVSVSALGGPVATAGTAPFEQSAALRRAVTFQGVERHLVKFDEIAEANGGQRASGFAGHRLSARYVARILRRHNYDVFIQRFRFEVFGENTPSVLEQTAPDQVSYINGQDFTIMQYSGDGDVTAELVAIDLLLPPGAEPSSSTSGCEASDFPATVAGKIALVQRGTCLFRDKVDNAEAAGAVGVVIFNEGQEGRTDLLSGTLGSPQADLPAVGTTFAVGEELSNGVTSGPTGINVHLKTDTFVEERQTRNVLAETLQGRSDNVVMAGGHLDSVQEGPGINDNGSGSAGLLETAVQMDELGTKPANKVRFAFWGAEEAGLIGSTEYVSSLSEAEVADIALYLNFDMIGSPNFARFIYDGNGSKFGASGPPGSDAIERVFERYFQAKGLASGQTEFSGRSDYGPFIDVGIPAGGLFTGAEGIKTEAQQAVYGGTEGEAYDPCYHQACDTVDNVSRRGLRQMSDALAHSVLTLAMSTEFITTEEARLARTGVRPLRPGTIR